MYVTRGVAVAVLLMLTGVITMVPLSAEEKYRLPPPRMQEIVDAPATPIVSLNPRGGSMLVCSYRVLVDIAYLAQPTLRLAGQRFLPGTNGAQRNFFVHEVAVWTLPGVDASRTAGIGTGAAVTAEVAATLMAGAVASRSFILPAGAKWGMPSWSPDGRRVAMAQYRDDGIELWVFDPTTGQGRTVTPALVSTVVMPPYTWAADGNTLYCSLVPAARGPAPQAPVVPTGPEIEQAAGVVSKVRTYQDLLKTAHDEALFAHYATVQLARVEVDAERVTTLGKPLPLRDLEISPDGRFVLVDVLRQPFSRSVPLELFAHDIEIWDATSGEKVTTVAQLPVADQLPIQGVPTGPRHVSWRPGKPATLIWTEALDGGDPNRKVPFRERLMQWAAPFTGSPTALVELPQRYAGFEAIADSPRAIVHDYDRDRKWLVGRLFDFDRPVPAASAPVLFDRSANDDYGDPGEPLKTMAPDGIAVAITAGNQIFMAGDGATPAGNRPFLRTFDLATHASAPVFVAAAEAYEQVVGFADAARTALITRRESPTAAPNYLWRPLLGGVAGPAVPITRFADPAPELTTIKKELLTYRRPDGVPLSGTLYYPLGYQPGQRVPVVLWAYPREYTDVKFAGQVRTTTNRFTRLDNDSILFMLTAGYAVLMDAEIPVVGDPLTANDTYVEQITAAAKAAVDQLVASGVADRHRIAVAGHSYGANMVANLLAHTDLFAAGIARSGAYNRTLTPFGFQGERRTFWEAPEIYAKLSPFSYAHRIHSPILMIHGELDNNPGTFPMQSERLFAAIRGHGGTARLVMLPYESHGYRARESVLHVLAEQVEWLDRYVRDRKPPTEKKPDTGSGSGSGPASPKH